MLKNRNLNVRNIGIHKFLASLQVNTVNRVAIHLDNSPDWLQIDTFLTEHDKVIVPVPHFFTSKQISFMSIMAGIDTVVCEQQAQPLWQSLGFVCQKHDGNHVLLVADKTNKLPKLPAATHKITFTSGTTSEPKGVCLSHQHLQVVGQSLANITSQFNVTKHLCLLPLSVLLENVAASYAARLLDIEIMTPSLSELGLIGSSQLDVKKLIDAIIHYKPDSIILMPQMLKAIIAYLQNESLDMSFLKFIAVGGAVCSKGLLNKARELDLPVYEGYGISECGSVISLNTDLKNSGSVGKILPHQKVKINKSSEILTSGQLFLGYLGEPENVSQWYATGDLGRIDEDNNLHIIGRKKNTIINSFGRNISPDWIEAELLALDNISQVAVFGEAQPYLTAICITSHDKNRVFQSIKIINNNLPDYAQVRKIIVSHQPFTQNNHMLTASGKTKHQYIFKHYKQQLQEIYAQA